MLVSTNNHWWRHRIERPNPAIQARRCLGWARPHWCSHHRIKCIHCRPNGNGGTRTSMIPDWRITLRQSMTTFDGVSIVQLVSNRSNMAMINDRCSTIKQIPMVSVLWILQRSPCPEIIREWWDLALRWVIRWILRIDNEYDKPDRILQIGTDGMRQCLPLVSIRFYSCHFTFFDACLRHHFNRTSHYSFYLLPFYSRCSLSNVPSRSLAHRSPQSIGTNFLDQLAFHVVEFRLKWDSQFPYFMMNTRMSFFESIA